MLSERQELLLRKLVEEHLAGGSPIGSKALAADPDVDCGSSTVRNELACRVSCHQVRTCETVVTKRSLVAVVGT